MGFGNTRAKIFFWLIIFYHPKGSNNNIELGTLMRTCDYLHLRPKKVKREKNTETA